MTDSGPADEEPATPLLQLRDGLPSITDTSEALTAVADRIAAGSGPVAIDAERASGYRYSQRAYLIQLRREGSGTSLVDPIGTGDLAPLADALDGTEWILHAATQDLPCLAEVGLRPNALFDTELAGRLLGYPRVALATLVEQVLGRSLRKEHSAADWSTRPLPTSWLEYAALDVEPLVELRSAMLEELRDSGKLEWARQEFEALLDFEPVKRADPWRRTSQLHRVRGRRGLAAVRALWETRDRIAADRDRPPGRVLPDAAIIEAAQALPTSRGELLRLKSFRGRGARRYASQWATALREAAELPEDELPHRAPRHDGPPPPRSWADRDPVAARRLSLARDAIAQLSEEHLVPVENLLTPDTVRRVLWQPPATRDLARVEGQIAASLQRYGARPWQIELVGPLLVTAIIAADQPD